jgi:hypothetical protein
MKMLQKVARAVNAVFSPLAWLIAFVMLLVLSFVAWLLTSLTPTRFSVAYVTYKYWGGGSKLNSQNFGLRACPEAFSVLDIPLNFASIAAQRIADGQAALGNADILEVARIKAGTYVLLAALQVTTVEGAARTVSVGDASSATAYLNAADINTVGWVTSAATQSLSVAVGGGKVYTADDSILVTLNNASIATAVCGLFMIAIDLTRFRSL